MPRGVYPRKTKKTNGAPGKAAKKLDPRATPETLKLDELTLLRLRTAQAELRAAEHEVTIQRGVKEGLLRKVDPQGVLRKLDEHIQRLTVAKHEAAQEYESIKKLVEEKYGIDLSKYSYDDKTGVLHDISPVPSADVPPAASQEALPTQNPPSVQ